MRCALAFALVFGCTKTSPPYAPPTSSASVAASSSAPDAGALRSPANASGSGLSEPPALATLALQVTGYPRNVKTGMNDPANVVGFTKDSAELGYCQTSGGRDPQTTRCELIARDGSRRTLSSDDAKGFVPKQKKEIDAFVASSGMTKLAPSAKDASVMMAPALVGSWRFSDITVAVQEIGGDGLSDARVMLGGAVGSDEPVFPVTIAASARGGKYHTAITNALALAPDGSDLGLVAYFFCGEWCDRIVLWRSPGASFASLVYNDSGFRKHKKGDFAGAAQLFLEATFADPNAKLPPYNLACAWARLGDARGRDALKVAIERDPSVKARAPKDEDFAAVKDQAWFRALVQ